MLVKHFIPLSVVVLIGLLACGQSSSESNNSSEQTVQQSASSAKQGSNAVARVVFIDQAQACECTQNRINGSWTALQAALGENSALRIDRIHRDTQEDQAEEFRLLRPMVTVPGLYFLDENDAIIELLQGEVQEGQIRAILERQN